LSLAKPSKNKKSGKLAYPSIIGINFQGLRKEFDLRKIRL